MLHRPVLVVALCLALLACGGEETPSPTPAAPAPSEGAAPAETPPPAAKTPAPSGSEDPELLISKGELPADFPSDIPTYPNAQPATSVAVPGGGMLVTFESDDDAEKILAHLRSGLESTGWQVSELAAGDLKATKEGRNARVTVSSQDDGRTRIAVGTTAQN